MTEFEIVNAVTEGKHHYNQLYAPKEIRHKNRYSDILAYVHTRVHLVPRALNTEGMSEARAQEIAQSEPREARAARKTDPQLVDGYINANFVDGPLGEIRNRKIIASQGPLENTYTDFWRMVSQENVTLIVTTCNTVEKGRPKCHHFWPMDPEQINSAASRANAAFWQ